MVIGLLMQDSEIKMCAGKETQAGFGNFVIHHRIELVALQPALGLMPDLANDIGFRVDLSYAIAKFLPKGIIVNFRGHVQAPADNAKSDPMVVCSTKQRAHQRPVLAVLWDSRRDPPAAITDGS